MIRYSAVNGYGFTVDEIEAENYMQFVRDHTETILSLPDPPCLLTKIVSKQDIPFEDIEELMDDYESERPGLPGMWALVADVMYAETGIRFSHQGTGEDQSPQCIMLETLNFWEYRITETVNKDKMDHILSFYLKDLYPEGKPESIFCLYWTN